MFFRNQWTFYSVSTFFQRLAGNGDRILSRCIITVSHFAAYRDGERNQKTQTEKGIQIFSGPIHLI